MNSPLGTVVATVSAEDRDSGTAGRVYYAMLDAITGFSIDRSTGLIGTTEKLQDKEYRVGFSALCNYRLARGGLVVLKRVTFSLQIRIGALDGNGFMSTNNATVTLITVKDNPLKWTDGPDTIDLKSSTVVGDVLATYETVSVFIPCLPKKPVKIRRGIFTHTVRSTNSVCNQSITAS